MDDFREQDRELEELELEKLLQLARARVEAALDHLARAREAEAQLLEAIQKLLAERE